MKIGEHEVKVIDKFNVQVGCQPVNRNDIAAVLSLMDTYSEGILVKDLPMMKPAIAINGEYKDHVFMRISSEVMRVSRTHWGWDSPTAFSYSQTRCRLLNKNETVTITQDGRLA